MGQTSSSDQSSSKYKKNIYKEPVVVVATAAEPQSYVPQTPLAQASKAGGSSFIDELIGEELVLDEPVVTIASTGDINDSVVGGVQGNCKKNSKKYKSDNSQAAMGLNNVEMVVRKKLITTTTTTSTIQPTTTTTTTTMSPQTQQQQQQQPPPLQQQQDTTTTTTSDQNQTESKSVSTIQKEQLEYEFRIKPPPAQQHSTGLKLKKNKSKKSQKSNQNSFKNSSQPQSSHQPEQQEQQSDSKSNKNRKNIILNNLFNLSTHQPRPSQDDGNSKSRSIFCMCCLNMKKYRQSSSTRSQNGKVRGVDDEQEVKDNLLNTNSNNIQSKTPTVLVDEEYYLEPPPVTCIRVLRPSNDLTPVRFDSHYNIIQQLTSNNSSCTNISEQGSVVSSTNKNNDND